MERIKETYGYPSKKDRKYKVLYAEIFGNKLNFAGIKYQYKLDVDKKTERIYLIIYNRYNKLIEKKVYWSFDYLKKRVETKLQYLAIINTWTNKIENWNYFKYYKMDIYKLKNFNSFIDLIEDGTIKLTIKIDIHLDKIHYGKTYDHGCGFTIEENKLYKLFEKINI